MQVLRVELDLGNETLARGGLLFIALKPIVSSGIEYEYEGDSLEILGGL